MAKAKLVVMVSGSGSNLQAILDSGLWDVTGVVSNKTDAYGLERARLAGVPYAAVTRGGLNREKFNMILAESVNRFEHDLVVLAGFMFIVDQGFLSRVGPVVNLHPAPSNSFVGAHGVEDAWKAYQKGEITQTGAMCHYVIPEVDRGEVLAEMAIAIRADDTVDSLRERVQKYEKNVLLSGIELALARVETQKWAVYEGKVRNVHRVGYDHLLMEHSDRQSAFDRHICEIPQKGAVLTEVAAWWFENTRHIVDNHYRWHSGSSMVVTECQPFKVEVVVRGYITGSTSTSLWTHYQRGERVYCGLEFPDGLVKNQKLDRPVITPTTKGTTDRPISSAEVVELGLVEAKDWDWIQEKALKLFEFGQRVADSAGLILVDTKYEFGRAPDGRILLIDELHTCDSSRFWLKESYSLDQEPEKFDKDVVRDWLKASCDPYGPTLPEIPGELIERAQHAYFRFAEMITGRTLTYQNSDHRAVWERYCHEKLPQVSIYYGSKSDESFVKQVTDRLDREKLYYRAYQLSAHKQTQAVVDKLVEENLLDKKVVNLCIAGASCALGAVVSYNSRFTTLNCPPYRDQVDMATNINSCVVNPRDIDVLFIMKPQNAVKALAKLIRA